MADTEWVWGLPLSRMTLGGAVDAVSGLIEARKPTYFITANVHYAMVTSRETGLREVNDRAAFLLADGAPLVWMSRLKRTPLPERVAGSDLIFALSERAASAGHRIFLFGAPPGVAEAAARRLEALYPGIQIVGTHCPPFRDLSDEETEEMIQLIRSARPDILFVAFGQPKGELWLSRHVDALGVPACVQVGASLDFVAGRVRRAPKFLRRIGMEWAYRIWTEPARLFPRYLANARFLAVMLARDLARGLSGDGHRARTGP